MYGSFLTATTKSIWPSSVVNRTALMLAGFGYLSRQVINTGRQPNLALQPTTLQRHPFSTQKTPHCICMHTYSIRIQHSTASHVERVTIHMKWSRKRQRDYPAHVACRIYNHNFKPIHKSRIKYCWKSFPRRHIVNPTALMLAGVGYLPRQVINKGRQPNLAVQPRTLQRYPLSKK